METSHESEKPRDIENANKTLHSAIKGTSLAFRNRAKSLLNRNGFRTNGTDPEKASWMVVPEAALDSTPDFESAGAVSGS